MVAVLLRKLPQPSTPLRNTPTGTYPLAGAKLREGGTPGYFPIVIFDQLPPCFLPPLPIGPPRIPSLITVGTASRCFLPQLRLSGALGLEYSRRHCRFSRPRSGLLEGQLSGTASKHLRHWKLAMRMSLPMRLCVFLLALGMGSLGCRAVLGQGTCRGCADVQDRRKCRQFVFQC